MNVLFHNLDLCLGSFSRSGRFMMRFDCFQQIGVLPDKSIAKLYSHEQIKASCIHCYSLNLDIICDFFVIEHDSPVHRWRIVS